MSLISRKKYTFNMPDGQVFCILADVDRYYNMRVGTTKSRLSRGWTEQECANNERVNYNYNYTFHMPDGTILHKLVDVDRYYNLGSYTTSNRLKSGWTIEECANNKRLGYKNNYNRIFHMPDGTILYRATKVDEYYNLRVGTTVNRLNQDWTEEECANNKRVNYEYKYTFHMPDGTTLHRATDVDRYYGFKKTATRLQKGWTEEECANNKKNFSIFRHKRTKHEFHMPDGTVLYKLVDVDNYHGLGKRTTSNRLLIGWTEEECANNKRG